MIVKAHNQILFTVDTGTEKFQIAMLPGVVSVYGPSGKQYFQNPRDLPARRLKEVFPSEVAIRKAASLDTITRVDMRRLMASLEKAHNEKRIGAADLRFLTDLLSRCDCTPEALRKKIEAAGYMRLLPHIEIQDHNPALDATVGAFKLFLENLK